MDEAATESVDNGSRMSVEGKHAAEAAVAHLRSSIEAGKHWYLALLEAIGLWAAPEEVYKGQALTYVIGGEAFDWLVLARRLCDSVDGLIPPDEKEKLLEQSEPPIEVSLDDFRRLVGGSKYRALLNYWYGVDVEKALVMAIGQAIRKERVAAGLATRKDVSELAYRRAYGTGKAALLDVFAKEHSRSPGTPLTAAEAKEFTYWLFKYRLDKHDKARVASDTKRGLQYLRRLSDMRPSTPFSPLNGS